MCTVTTLTAKCKMGPVPSFGAEGSSSNSLIVAGYLQHPLLTNNRRVHQCIQMSAVAGIYVHMRPRPNISSWSSRSFVLSLCACIRHFSEGNQSGMVRIPGSDNDVDTYMQPAENFASRIACNLLRRFFAAFWYSIKAHVAKAVPWKLILVILHCVCLGKQ